MGYFICTGQLFIFLVCKLQGFHAFSSRKYPIQYRSLWTSFATPPRFQTSSLLPDPAPNSIGNFFENKTEAMSFIQCYMLSVGIIDNTQYGIGFPVDMPVMLTYFEGNELIPVQQDYPDYDHLINHVSVQLDSNDLQLYNTPVVLTLQGEFEDDDLNQLYPGPKIQDEANDDMLDFDEEDREEITIADVIRLEGMDNEDDVEFDDDDDNDDDDDDDDDDEGSMMADEEEDEDDDVLEGDDNSEIPGFHHCIFPYKTPPFLLLFDYIYR
jgi:hypothetical protein